MSHRTLRVTQLERARAVRARVPRRHSRTRDGGGGAGGAPAGGHRRQAARARVERGKARGVRAA
eukprot:9498213-Pyramimonas_sp.AAC.1